MRIAILAPVWETVPPPGYGGIELVVSLLVGGLLEAGHEPVLFATGDSHSPAPLSWLVPRPLRKLGFSTDRILSEPIRHVTRAFRQADSFDVIHNHEGVFPLALTPFVKTPTVSTLHGPVDGENRKFYEAYRDRLFVSISEAQRKGCPSLHYAATVYNGIDTSLYAPGPRQGYLLFLGRISPEKGTHLAIQAAMEAGVPLVIAGKVDPYDRAYFERLVRPHLDGSSVRFIGEVGGVRKSRLLAGAMALVHPVQWPEPFGLVMPEALASGIPVIALNHGSIPEIVEHGKTGYVLDSPLQFAQAIRALDRIAPSICRAECVRRFHYSKMVEGYLAVYRGLAAKGDSDYPGSEQASKSPPS